MVAATTIAIISPVNMSRVTLSLLVMLLFSVAFLLLCVVISAFSSFGLSPRLDSAGLF
jgi:hypothetical protein